MGSPLFAEVSFDGSLGSQVALEGPNYQIGAELGQQRGSNLFHSFDNFNLNPEESATFLGPDKINNIISRVTGGNPSNIEGTLRSLIPKADVYLINPAGIMFGPHAQLDVQGSFHASTADTLYFQDGTEFNANPINNALLTTAAPEAFGFLDHSSTPLFVKGSQLSVPLGETISLVGGDVDLDAVEITAKAGRINIGSLSHAGKVVLSPTDLTLSAQAGDITLRNSVVSTSGESGGAIYIRGGRFELHNSEVAANTEGKLDGKGINVQVTELTVSEGGQFAAHTLDSGKGGVIKINVADSMMLKGINQEGFFSGIFANSESKNDNAGDANDIVLEVGELVFKEGAWMAAETHGPGQGGNVIIRVKAGQLILSEGAQIYTGTRGTGRGGNVDIKVAEDVTFSGRDQNGSLSGIFSFSWTETDYGGNAGDIVLEAQNLNLKEGTGITASTYGTGQGGDIKILVNNSVNLSGENYLHQGTFLKSSTEGIIDNAGNGGTITIAAQQLKVTDGGQIGAITFGPGDGGRIHIKVADQVSISGTDSGQNNNGTGFPSGIFTNSDDARTNHLGRAGEIILETNQLNLGEAAKISASTRGAKSGGDIKVQARHIRLTDRGKITAESRGEGEAGNIILVVDEQLNMQHSTIETAAVRADGGDITVISNGYLYLIDSGITTSVQTEKGDGGNIVVQSKFIVPDGSHIIARSVGGKGGNIKISTTGIYEFSESVIDASSQLGVDGEVIINSPDINVSGGLIILSTQFVDVGRFLEYFCKTYPLDKLSQFIVVSFAGSPPTPEDWQGSHLLPTPFESDAEAVPPTETKSAPVTVMKATCASGVQ